MTTFVRRFLPLFLFASTAITLTAQNKEEDFYKISPIQVPEGVVFETSGIELLPEGKIAVCSRRGDVYTIEGAYGSTAETPKWTLFAEGLHEPLGLAWQDGWLLATQRPEVTKMKDEDGDGRADVFVSLNSGWGINGDYHEYAFGSRPDKDGSIWVVLCLTGSGSANSNFRGWCVRVTKDGEMIPTCSGIRSPGGIGENSEGDYFYADNQGLWNGSSSIKHLKPGGFMGNPTGNKYYSLTDAIGPRPVDPKSESRMETERKRVKELVPPAVIFPHGKMGQSTSGIACDTSDGKFGPFKNQLFVCDQTFSTVQRAFLEKVNGVYQGACFPFKSGFGSGNVAIRMSPDGSLFVGGTDRGWGARGGKGFALERLNWTGKIPFEIHEMRAKPDGFDLTFTKPVDPKTAGDPSSYKMKAYTYIYKSGYGSPEVDKSEPKITKAIVSQDGKSVRLTIDKIVKGHVHDLDASGIRSAEGDLPLLHNKAYYTLNEIPSK